MQAKGLVLGLIFGISATVSATTHVIKVADNGFTPGSIEDVRLGDTLMWTWTNGSHTTTSTDVPAGAAFWNNPIDSGSASFVYVPTVPGTYDYQCDLHFPAGMTGRFTVIGESGVEETILPAMADIFPNPVSEKLHVQFHNTDPVIVIVLNTAGKHVVEKKFKGSISADISMDGIPDGNYLFRTVQNRNVYCQYLVIAH